MEDTRSNQSKALVRGDQAGRDIFKTTNFYSVETTHLAVWFKKLDEQIAEDMRDARHHFVDTLKFFVDRRDDADVVGLDAKIKKSGFNISYLSAIEKKEAFAKLLLKYQEFSCAQELFGYFLSHIYEVFDEKICPFVETMTYQDVQDIVDREIIDKIFLEIGSGSTQMLLSKTHVRGMIYWLADKCFVRWHSC